MSRIATIAVLVIGLGMVLFAYRQLTRDAQNHAAALRAVEAASGVPADRGVAPIRPPEPNVRPALLRQTDGLLERGISTVVNGQGANGKGRS